MFCADGLVKCISYNTIENTTSHSDHSHPTDQEDDCTPFCTCSCCGTFLVIPIILKPSKVSSDLSTTYQIHYTFDYAFDYIEGVWHPPSIV